MIALMIEIAGYLGAAALIGLILGYLVWGWGHGRRIEDARAEGAAAVRTSVDGVDLREQVDSLQRENANLKQQIEELHALPEPDITAEPTVETAELASESDDALPAQPSEPPVQVEPFDPNKVRRRANLRPATGQLGTIRARFADTSGADLGDRNTDRSDLDALDGIDPDFEYAASDPKPAHTDAAMPDFTSDDRTTVSSGPAQFAPANLLRQRPEEVDDLKRIKGVGSKMEAVLNEKGVYQFRQIAAFSGNDIDWVNEAIEAFPGRIERDDWVGQARELHLEKYGRAFDEEQA